MRIPKKWLGLIDDTQSAFRRGLQTIVLTVCTSLAGDGGRVREM